MLLFGFVTLFNALTICEGSKVEAAPLSKMIVGYYPEWGVYAAHNMHVPADIPWDKITHVKYAFAKTSGGKVSMFDDWAATGISFGETWNSPYKGTYGQFKKLKFKYPNVNVLVSIGGWTQSGGFHQAGLTDASRTAFADSAVAFCRQWGFDGVDIDWEFPCVPRDPDVTDTPGDTGNPAGPEDEYSAPDLTL